MLGDKSIWEDGCVHWEFGIKRKKNGTLLSFDNREESTIAMSVCHESNTTEHRLGVEIGSWMVVG